MYVVPTDHKWFSRLATAAVLVTALDAINPRYPAADPSVAGVPRSVPVAVWPTTTSPDYTDVNPVFGTLADFDDLRAGAHRPP